MNLRLIEREFDFALIVGGVGELTQDTENALFEAGLRRRDVQYSIWTALR